MKGRVSWVENARIIASLLETHVRDEDGDLSDVSRDSLTLLDFAEIAIAEIARLRVIESCARAWMAAHDLVVDHLIDQTQIPFDLVKSESDCDFALRDALDAKPEGEG